MKFTYKRHTSTGRYKSFDHERHDIKLKKKVVGHIKEASHFSNLDGFGIMLATKKSPTTEEPANFKWVFLKRRFKTAQEAKVFLDENFQELTAQHDLYSFED